MIKGITRRDFLKGMVVGGTAVGAMGLLAACGSSSQTTSDSQTSSSEESAESVSESTATDEIVTTEDTTSTYSTALVTSDVVFGGSNGEGCILGKDGHQTLINYCTNGVEDMNPFHQVITNAVVTMVYMRLAFSNENNELVSDVCENIEEVEPGVYRVTLYDNIVDQAGYPFTADDLVFCMNSTAAEGYNTAYASSFASVEKEDDLTCLIYTADTAYSSFITLCAGTLLVTEESFEESPDQMSTTPVGFTQYKVSDFVPGSYCDFEVAGDYWQTDVSKISRHYEANVDKVHIIMLRESSQKVAGLLTGDINLVGGLDYNTMQAALESEQFQVGEVFNLDGCKTLCFNMTEGTVCGDDINLRMAILHSIDRNNWVEAFGSGRIMNSLVDRDYLNYDEAWDDMDYFVYDLDLAQEYLAASNYQGEKIRILGNPGSDSTTQCEVLMASLETIGINTELVTYEQATYGSAQYASSGAYDIMFLEVYAKSHDTYDALVTAGASSYSDVEGLTKYGWNNQELIEICDSLASEEGRTEENRTRVYELLTDNAVMMGTFVKSEFVVCDKNIEEVYMYSGICIPNATHFSADYDVYAD